MLWPFFLSRHAKSLNFAHLSFSLRAAFSSLFSLTPGMNAVPDSSRAHPPSRVFPQSLSGFTRWRQSSRISIFRIWIGRSGLRRSVWVTGLRHYRNLQFFWPGDRIIVATTTHNLYCLLKPLQDVFELFSAVQRCRMKQRLVIYYAI